MIKVNTNGEAVIVWSKKKVIPLHEYLLILDKSYKHIYGVK